MSDINIAAEEGVLASIFNNPDELSTLTVSLTPEDFIEPRYGKIFEAIKSISKEGGDITGIRVIERLRRFGVLPEIGGPETIVRLSDPSAEILMQGDLKAFASFVKDDSVRRDIANMATRITGISRMDSGYTIEETLAEINEEISAISQSALLEAEDGINASNYVDSMMEILRERMTSGNEIQGIPTGFPEFDKLTSGLNPAQMIVIAARPAVGKSTLAVDIARNVSFNVGMKVAIFSLEMGRTEIMERIISAESEVELNKIRSGLMDNDELARVKETMERLRTVSIHIDDSPNLTMEQIRAKALHLMRTEGLDLVIIDYLQLMSSGKRVESRQQEVSEFSRAIKLLAKELHRPVIAVSQLNRGSEQRADKRPTTAELRESGSIEQDADMIILLYRTLDEETGKEKVYLLLAKNRQGPTADIELIPMLQCAKFVSSSGVYATETPDVFETLGEETYSPEEYRAMTDQGAPSEYTEPVDESAFNIDRSTGEMTPVQPSQPVFDTSMEEEPLFPTNVAPAAPTERGAAPAGPAF